MLRITLPAISGAILRGKRYRFNLPIPKTIRVLYNNDNVFRGTMGTSDPAEANRQVTDQKAIFNRQIRNAQRDANQARVKILLKPSDRSTVTALGGAEIVPHAFDHLRGNVAFLEAQARSMYYGADTRFVLGSNDEHVMNIENNGSERRFCVIKVSDAKAGDLEYFDKLRVQLKVQMAVSSSVLPSKKQSMRYFSSRFRLFLAIELGTRRARAGGYSSYVKSHMEIFFSSLKIKRVKRKVYRTRDQARADVFDYFERFYNLTRHHPTIGYPSPMQYEERAMKA